MSRFIYGLLNRLHPLFDADGDGSGAGAGASGAGTGTGDEGSGEGAGAGDGAGEGAKAYTEAEAQAKIDAAVKDRLNREKKKTDASISKLQKQLDELSGKAPAGDGEGAGAEGSPEAAAAIAKAATMLEQANARVINATAHTEAVKLGVDPKYVADAVRLADLSKIEVSEDGSIDEKAISKALDEVLKRLPAFKTDTGGAGSGGFRVGGNGSGSGAGGNGWSGKAKGNAGATESTSGKRWNKFNG